MDTRRAPVSTGHSRTSHDRAVEAKPQVRGLLPQGEAVVPPAGFEPALPPPEAGTRRALGRPLVSYQSFSVSFRLLNAHPCPLLRSPTRSTFRPTDRPPTWRSRVLHPPKDGLPWLRQPGGRPSSTLYSEANPISEDYGALRLPTKAACHQARVRNRPAVGVGKACRVRDHLWRSAE